MQKRRVLKKEEIVSRDTEKFLHLLEAQNVRIANTKKEKIEKTPPDLMRQQREKERREKFGTLQAKKQSGQKARKIMF